MQMINKIHVLAVMLMAVTAFGDYNYYVVPPGTPGVPENPDYLSWETAGTDIHEAVYLAGAKDSGTNQKNVPHRLYIMSGTYQVERELVISDCYTEIRSSKGPQATDELDREGTILIGSYPASKHRIFKVDAGSESRPVQLRGLTIKNGYAEGNGGGVYFSGCKHVTSGIYDCTVEDCVAELGAGGGICFRPSNQRYGLVTNCYVSGCMATNDFISGQKVNQIGGGGIAIGLNGSTSSKTSTRTEGFRIFDTVISNNTVCGNAICGSGVFNYAQGVWIENCTIVDNHGTTMTGGNMGYPGAVHLGGRSRVIGCTFLRNVAGGASSGPACLNTYAGTLVTNCTFIGNVNATKTQPDVDCAEYIWKVNATSSFTGAVEVVGCTFIGSKENNHPALIVKNNSVVRNSLVFGYGSISGDSIGAVCFRSSGCKFENNTVVGCEKAMYCLGSVDPGVVNSAFYANDIDLHQAALSGVHSGVSFTNCYFTSEARIGNQANVDCVFAADPKFIDDANGDFRLQRRSPLRDKGLLKSWMTGATDLDGNPRLLDRFALESPLALPDIGCYECGIKAPGFFIKVQ